MDYLARESAGLSEGLWAQIDEAVIGALKEHLVCRRFLKLFGPLGAGKTSVFCDGVDKQETLEGGLGRISGRTQLELPLLFEDFDILGRDLEYAKESAYPLDLSAALRAAKRAALREDELILLGNTTLGVPGLTTAKGATKIKKTDWKQGENGYTDVARAVVEFTKKGYLGRYALIVSPDVYLDLQRLQPTLGLLEIDRIKKLIGDNVSMYGNFGTNKAVLVCVEPEYIDLAVGLDFSVGYVELADFNHAFRIMETAALRIKDPGAIVVFS